MDIDQKIEFIIQKTHFFDKFKNTLSVRQKKVINRIFEEGIDGFEGGLITRANQDDGQENDCRVPQRTTLYERNRDQEVRRSQGLIPEWLSAENYIAITKTSTATRDLRKLVEIGAFKKTSQLKSSRYWINL